MENVTSMKPSEKETISLVLGEFYTNDLWNMCCYPVRINSSLVSAQMRDRLYWCNWDVKPPKDKGIILQDILEPGAEAFKEKSYALTATYENVCESDYFEHSKRELIKVGTPVPELAKKSLALTANYGKLNEKNFAKGIGQLVKIGNIKNDSIPYRVYSSKGKSVTQNANGGGLGAKTGLYKIGKNVRKLTPRECCRLQTYDERVFDLFTMYRKESTSGKPYMSKNAFYNVFGDSFTVDIIVHILQCSEMKNDINSPI
jgi:DNA (cytosine-5)-methyltransferase 3A